MYFDNVEDVIKIGFYNEISKYYDYIFPVGDKQIDFIVDAAGKPPKRIVDVACGTGSYTLKLASMGYDVTGIDLDEKMIESAMSKEKAARSGARMMTGDMLKLPSILDGNYDLIFCIGNSIVHLDGPKEIEAFLLDVKKLLNDEGSAVFQIINYDRIIKKGITSLPTISNDKMGLEFKRIYEFDENSGKVLFKTTLTVHNEKIKNTISLFPLLSSDFYNMIKKVGFRNVEMYGDFEGASYNADESYACIMKIR